MKKSFLLTSMVILLCLIMALIVLTFSVFSLGSEISSYRDFVQLTSPTHGWLAILNNHRFLLFAVPGILLLLADWLLHPVSSIKDIQFTT